MKIKIYIVLAFAALFSACDKGELVESTEYEKIQPGDPKYSYIKILNLTPSSPVVNFYMDGKKFTSALSSTGIENSGYAYNGLFPDLGYAVTSPGAHKLTAKIIPSATLDANLEVFSRDISPAAGQYYSILTTGVYANKTIPSSIVLEDKRPATDTSKVFVRLVNVLNGGSSLDLVKGDVSTGPKLISNVTVGGFSDWVEVPQPGAGVAPSIKFWLNNSVTQVPVVAAGFTASLSKGRAYTIYVRGVVGNTSFPATISFFTTFY